MSNCRLYLVSPPKLSATNFATPLREALAGGDVASFQLRLKDVEDDAIRRAADFLRPIVQAHGAAFILNDRPDLALEAGADGVHVGQDDAPVALARRILGADAIIGLSTHGPVDLAAATGDGGPDVTYISAGPVEPTPTKPGRPGTGLDYLTLATATATFPVFVTGGVTPGRIPTLAGAGARHFVVVRYLTEAADPRQAARALRNAIDEVVEV